MTDNRTTEKLMREFVAVACECEVRDYLISEYAERIEQAIAATLGSDDEYEAKMDELLCRLTNGKWSKTRQYSLEFMDACISEEFEALYSEEQFSAPVHGALTAEQVLKVVEKHWHDLPDEYDMPEATALPEYSYDWQAIADELNAELGSGACKLIDTTSPSNDDYWNSAKCSECGAEFTCAIFGRALDAPDANYCPNCGARVVDR